MTCTVVQVISMGWELKLIALLMIAAAFTTTVAAIDQLKGITYWDVAEITNPSGHHEIGDYHQVPWRFESFDANANAGTVEATNLWVGTWNAVGPCTIYCKMTSGYDEWYLTFINPKYFIAYKNDVYLYRFGHLRGVGGTSADVTPTPVVPSDNGGSNAISLEQNTDRPGMNYKNYATSQDPQICANDCANDPNCRAFTYVEPGVRGPNSPPECWLKNGVPNAVSGDCCVSGVKI